MLPCVRPVGAVHMTAGHNSLRGSGPGQKPAFDDAMAQMGCPDRRIDRLCITCCSPSQPSHHAGCPPGRMPMKPSICSGLRRLSLARSAAVRSEHLTIWAICSDESGGELCCAVVARPLRNRPALTPTATKRHFVLLFMVLLIAVRPFHLDRRNLIFFSATTEKRNWDRSLPTTANQRLPIPSGARRCSTRVVIGHQPANHCAL